MKTFLSQSTLARRLNLSPATLIGRLREFEVVPDGVVITGEKQGIIFDAERLPELRNALAPTRPQTKME